MKSRALVTRKMVAEEAGVSVTIGSYVINNNRYVDMVFRRSATPTLRKCTARPSTSSARMNRATRVE